MIRHKFNAKPCNINGIHFGSKKEAAYYMGLLERQKTGEVVFFLRQVPFDLGGGVTYRCDFLLFKSDGSAEFVEVKGFETETWKIKRKLVEDKYPITLTIV